MVGKICVDTDVFIDILKKNSRVKKAADKLKTEKAYTTTVNVFELHLRKTNLDVIRGQLKTVNILDFDEKAAIKASEIEKDLKEKGIYIGFRDIFIAAISIVNNCRLLTFNKKHFENIPGLKIAEF